MDSRHLIETFRLLVLLIALALGIAAYLAYTRTMNDAMVVILSSVVTGSFTLLRSPSSKSVTVDNPASDPVQVEGAK